MPSDKRSRLKRQTAQAYNAGTKMIFRIGELHEQFEPRHKDYAELLLMIAQTVFVARELLKSFATKAWGEFPENPDVWL